MSGVGSVSGSGSIWQSLKSIFADTTSDVKSDLKTGQSDARAAVQSKVNEVKDSASEVRTSVSSLRRLIDTWI